MTFNTVSKMYQGTGILKGDYKQPLRIEKIRALNECTGRLFRATTRHNHKSSESLPKTDFQNILQNFISQSDYLVAQDFHGRLDWKVP